MEKIKKHKKLIIIIAVILVVAIGVGIFFFMPKKSTNTKKADYTKLTKMHLIKSVSESGNIESQNTKKVYSTSSNVVKEINVALGDTVSAGQVLSVLDNKSADSDLQSYKSAQNSLASAQLTLNTKKTIYERNCTLYDQGALSKSDLDQSQTDYQSAVLSYQKAQDSLDAALNTMNNNISDSYVKAPISGTITAVYAKVGSSGSGLEFVIEDTSSLEVTTYISEYDYSLVKPGQTVQIKTDATGTTIINGTVSKVSPAAVKTTTGDTDTSGSITYETKVTVNDKNDLLKIGMSARLTIIVDEKEGVFAVPYAAVKTTNGKSVIYAVVQKDGKNVITEIPVTTGIETDLYTEVSGDGLTVGMSIVNEPTSVKAGDVVST